MLPGVGAVPVDLPPRPFIDGAVALKRMFIRHPRMRASTASTGEGAQGSTRRSGFAKIRDAYFGYVYFIDGYKRWAWRAARAAIRAGSQNRVTLILASGPPHSTLIAGAFAARMLRVPFVADLRDPWSDDVNGALHRRGCERKLLSSIEHAVLASASAITSTGATLAGLLAARNETLRGRLHLIRNGYDGAVCRPATGTNGRLSILFAGELYVGRDPFPFLHALEWLLGQPGVDSSRVQVTFMGKADAYDGKKLSEFLKGTRSVSVVKVIPPQSQAAVATAVEQSTVLLNLAQGQRLSVPAKTFEHLASGRENLLICEDDCETARLVVGIAGVNQVDPKDFPRLTATFLSLYNRHVLLGKLTSPDAAEIVRFSRESSNDEFLKLLSLVSSDWGAKGGRGSINTSRK